MTDHDETPGAAGASSDPTTGATPSDDPHATAVDGSSATGDGQPLTRREMRAVQARKRRPVLRGIVIVLVVVLAGVVGTGAYVFYHLNGNIKSLSVDSSLLKPKPNATTDPTTGHTAMNILLMGVDSRAGANAGYGNADDAKSGERSDTTMLIHLAADRRSAIVVSIPRDTIMLAPPRKGASEATEASDSTSPVASSTPVGCDIDAPKSRWVKGRMFNENIEIGGVDCVLATVMHNTGLSIDHAMSVDFTGFKEIVNAMGTVEICTTTAIKDKLSGLDLTAGRHELNGEQALAFVRTRHGVGDGSDLGRLRLQQDFAAAVIRKATSTGVLLNPGKLYGVLDAATKALRTDPGLKGGGALADLANQLRAMKPANVHFITAPTEPYPANTARVQLSPAAAELWDIIGQDKPWPDGSADSSPSATATPTATIAPSSVTVSVQNASGTTGYATQVSAALKAQGFTVASLLSSPQPVDGVVIHHTAAQAEEAAEVALAFPGARLKADGAGGDRILVSVGRGSKPVVLVPNHEGSGTLPPQPLKPQPVDRAPTTGASPTLTAKAASEDVCSDTSRSAGNR